MTKLGINWGNFWNRQYNNMKKEGCYDIQKNHSWRWFTYAKERKEEGLEVTEENLAFVIEDACYKPELED